MPRFTPLFIGALLCLLAAASPATAHQEAAPLKRAIEAFLRVQVKGLPGQASFSVGDIDPQNQLVPCPAFTVSMPPGARAWGRTNVSVRCEMTGGWRIFVPVRIRIQGDYLITARALNQGQVVGAADLAKNRGDLTDLPASVLTDPAQAIGKTVAQSVSSGQPLRSDMLRQTLVVQQGQSVRVVSRGPGFQVSGGAGRALGNAAAGQVVQVRMPNGRIVSGLAREGGVVEIAY